MLLDGLILMATRAVLRQGEAAPIVALLALSSLAWLITDLRMAGMDAGPWTDPGSFGFYLSTWIVMMAAMMLPSSVPMVLVFRRLERARSALPVATSAFVVGYLVVWTASGLVAYAALKAGQAGGIFAWDHSGQAIAVGALVTAALYEMTRPRPDACGNAARPWNFCSARGETGCVARSTWAPGMADGVWGAAGR